MRRATGASVALLSCAAIVASWRIGESPRGTSTAQGVHVVEPAPGGSGSATVSPRPSATAGTSPHAAGPATFTGATVQTPYGDVQVRAVVQGRRLLDVVPLRLTDSSGRSVSISARAAPILRREALSAGSAHIDTVSGASYTSQAYIESLQSALDTARAAA
ncbi:MAG: FMN-binding protein [Actinomycetales bacterium]